MTRRWSTVSLILLPLLLTILTRSHSASAYHRLTCGHGRTYPSAGLNERIPVFDLFSSTTSFNPALKQYHETRDK